ncbi:hypothetical protein LSM04_004237 [Trypanosoma melophagium]|uniref:uncharacterized protein n=1 Tax=Trypanosoma melophagium TaxID=715481 RepID=UPI00351AA519|nr:hypothetical protein LSM04_004237 [Trypanosoma melophagium]
MLTFDKLPVALGAEHNASLEDTVDNVLASSHSVLNTTRRLSEIGLDGGTLILKHTNFGFHPPAAPGGDCEADSLGSAVGALRAQLEECRAVLRRVECERRFLRGRAAELQRGVAAAEGQRERLRAAAATAAREAREARRVAASERRRLREAETAAMAATEEQMRLRRCIRAVPFTPAEARAIVPDRRFEEAFRDKMDAIRFRRRYQRAKQLHQRRAESAERERMQAEDEGNDPIAYGGNVWNASSEVPIPAPLTPSTNLSSSYNGLSLSQLGSASYSAKDVLGVPFQLPFVHTTARDSYILTVMQKAPSSEALTRLRDGLIRICSRLKQGQDSGVRSMYSLMLECMRGGERSSGAFFTDPKKSFEIVVEKTQRVQRDLLYDLLELVNSAVIEIAECESSSIHKKVTTHNAGCSVYFPGVPDLRLADIEERLEAQRKRLALTASASTITSTTAGKTDSSQELLCTRAECRTLRQKALFTVKQLLSLHGAVYRTAEFVYAFYTPTEVEIQDPFKDLNILANEATLENPRFETKVAEAVEADVRQAGKIIECIMAVAKTSSSGTSKQRASIPTPRAAARSKQQHQHQQQQQQPQKQKQEPRYMARSPQSKKSYGGKVRASTEKLPETLPTPSKETPYFSRRFNYAKMEEFNDMTLGDIKQSQDNSPKHSIMQLNVTTPPRPSGAIVPHATFLPRTPSESQHSRVTMSTEKSSPQRKSSTLTKVNLPQFIGK